MGREGEKPRGPWRAFKTGKRGIPDVPHSALPRRFPPAGTPLGLKALAPAGPPAIINSCARAAICSGVFYRSARIWRSLRSPPTPPHANENVLPPGPKRRSPTHISESCLWDNGPGAVAGFIAAVK